MASDNPSIKNDGFVSARRSVTFHPSIWGDHFLTYTSDLTQIQGHEQEELEKLKEEVRNQLQADDDSMKKLELIDAIQRLGVAHHFTQEIDKSLKYIHDTYNDYNDLHATRPQHHLFWWWKGLDFENKLAFARNRVAESYFWALAIHFEPQYHLARRLLTKRFLDGRWGSSALETLPPYMKLCYQALLDVYAEMEDEMKTLGTSYRMYYAQEEMKKLVKSYFQEAKWLYNNYIPTMEEYMMVGLVSSTYMVLPTTSLVGMGSLVTKETFEWISNEPLIIRASSAIGRLMNDLVGYGIHKKYKFHTNIRFETKSSAVECYMKQNGASKEEAFGTDNISRLNVEQYDPKDGGESFAVCAAIATAAAED
ncbi:hypothetical protein BUALT_Bualt02G0031900 [Buddleja alternifolia]|uniref:Uncharacterized protein n=1 Tax=Buddleja alternifolia TaxID=168488 RepID=A0AAV6Y5J1_9LAMI|nr:hypothetical protein BUALT_Bualt02G0031900 [Buddleja alternifolia]